MLHRGKLLKALALLLTETARLCALDPSTAIADYGVDVWQTERGLSHNSVRAVTRTADGRLWLATSRSLMRFDGTTFHNVALTGLTGVELTTLAVQADGQLAVGALRGVFRIVGDKAELVHPSKDVNSVRSLLAAPDGALWIGTEYGIRKSVGGHIALRIGAPDQPVFRANALAADGAGGVWIGTPGGVLHLRAGSEAAEHVALNGIEVRSLVRDREGWLWIGTDSDGLYRLVSNTLPHGRGSEWTYPSGAR